ncbi:MAG: acyl-CoA carboxylase subunit beta [Reyranellaceae bacterium]
MEDRLLDELADRRRAARAMGGAERVRKVRDAGKLPVRERLDILFDAGSFEEMGLLAHSQYPGLQNRTPADGVVTGCGTIEGRRVFVMADDPSVLAGTRGRVAEEKLIRLRSLALRERLPLVMLNEAGAARVQETNGAYSAGLGGGFAQHFELSGVVPQVSVHMGASFGGPSFVGSMCDFVAMVKGTGFMGMSGPPIVKVGIGVDHSFDEIGGPDMAMRATGQLDYLGVDEADALQSVRRYLSYLPSSCHERPPSAPPRAALSESEEGAASLRKLVPQGHRQAYSMHRLLQLVVDADSLFELHADYGRNLITALARIDGQPVGLVANNPSQRAGVLDEKAAIKARRFIDVCDAFHIPLAFFCDTPGFLVGPEVEKQRMVALCGRLMMSLISASVPKIQIVVRKAVGMAYIAMCGRACRPNAIVAWPTAFFDVMGPEAGVMLAHEKEIMAASDPEARKREILKDFEVAASAYATAGLGLIDDVIAPGETRALIARTIRRAGNGGGPGFKRRIEP